jgi:2-polyprenyl-6-hydroxyphenyl methylase / 3-demethylubiquinone-9 3-methyltransferase
MESTSVRGSDLTAAVDTVDPAEVAKFERMAAEWWDADGKFRPLHKLNPARLSFVRDAIAEHFGRDAKAAKPLAGLSVLDIGCGGGLLTEPMARLGAEVVGADPSHANIEAARRHAEQMRLAIDYRDTTAEALAAAHEAFDVVLALEVVEHVADVEAFLHACAALTKPGGLFIVATINRTAKAFALAIVGAEYVLRWLPRGTHDYSKLIRPAELETALGRAGLGVIERSGVTYNPLMDRWSLSSDTDVNYMMAAEKRQPQPG